MNSGTAIVLGIAIAIAVVGFFVWKWRPDAHLECETDEERVRAAHQYLEAIEYLPSSSPKYIEANRLWEKQVPDKDLRKHAFLQASAERVKKAGEEAYAAAKKKETNRA